MMGKGWLSNSLAIALSSVALFSCSGDDNPSGPTAGWDCGVTACNPLKICTMTGADTVSFGYVDIGDTVSTVVQVWHFWPSPYDPTPPPPLPVRIVASSDPSFSWLSGERTLDPGEWWWLEVKFHPTTADTHSCTLRTSKCGNLSITGFGVKESDRPRGTGVFSVMNSGSYDVRVFVHWVENELYDYTLCDTIPQKAIGNPWNTVYREFYVYSRAEQVQIRAESATSSSVDPWVTVFELNFPQPVTKCYVLSGTASNPEWSELAGCHFGQTCNCFAWVWYPPLE